MDPLTALSVATAVIQIVEFSSKVVSRGGEIYRSAEGSSVNDSALNTVTADLNGLLVRLRGSVTQDAQNSLLTAEEQSLQTLAKGCEEVAKELVTRFEKLKTPGRAGKWDSFRLALLSVWSEKDIQEVSARLELYRRELDTSLLVSLRERFKGLAIEQSDSFKELDESLKLGIQAILDSQTIVGRDIRRDVELQTDVIIGDSVQQHNKTREEYLKGNDRIINEIRRLGTCSEHSPENGGIPEITNASSSADEKSEPTFLTMLAFPVMEDRHEQIRESYKNTFAWIFQEPKTSTRPWSNFTTWLKSRDTNLYWINGKAASGKSTLMNYLLGHTYTKALLSQWSGDVKLVSASFFFWNSGTTMQRSQRGLIRSLLYQILKQEPRLVPVVYLDLNFFSTSTRDTVLIEALFKLCNQDRIPLKLFLLIDGLDEYDGDHIDLAILFKRISKCPNVKVCVSSRPLPVFDKTFKGLPTLQLQDLTFEDIQFYVQDKLGTYEMMIELRQKEGDLKSDTLLASIVDKAQGVFLWIQLVVKSLMDGLTNEDEMVDLQARVDALPSEIEDLYSHMLQNIASIYRAHSSRLFQIMRACYDAKSKAELPLNVQEMAFADQTLKEVLNARVEPLTAEEEHAQFRSLELRLKTRCAGMLEIVYKDPAQSSDNDNPCFRLRELDFQVEYIHRTARDYLAQPEIWQNIVHNSQVDQVQFDPFTTLLGASVMQVKVVPPLKSGLRNRIYTTKYTHGFFQMIRKVLGIAALLEECSVLELVALLDNFDYAATIHWDKWINDAHRGVYSDYIDQHIRHEELHLPDPKGSMLTLAIRSGLYLYVQSKLDHDINLLKCKPGRPLLDYAAQPPLRYSSLSRGHMLIASLLLSKGASPNQEFYHTTPWKTLLYYLDSYGRLENFPPLSLRLEVARMFVEHGASPSATITIRMRQITLETDKGDAESIKSVAIPCQEVFSKMLHRNLDSDNDSKIHELLELLQRAPSVPNVIAKRVAKEVAILRSTDQSQINHKRTEKRSRCCF